MIELEFLPYNIIIHNSEDSLVIITLVVILSCLLALLY